MRQKARMTRARVELLMAREEIREPLDPEITEVDRPDLNRKPSIGPDPRNAPSSGTPARPDPHPPDEPLWGELYLFAVEEDLC